MEPARGGHALAVRSPWPRGHTKVVGQGFQAFLDLGFRLLYPCSDVASLGQPSPLLPGLFGSLPPSFPAHPRGSSFFSSSFLPALPSSPAPFSPSFPSSFNVFSSAPLLSSLLCLLCSLPCGLTSSTTFSLWSLERSMSMFLHLPPASLISRRGSDGLPSSSRDPLASSLISIPQP